MQEKREKLSLTKKQAQKIIWGDSKEFRVVEKNFIGLTRWSVTYEVIINRLSDNKYFKDSYSVAATELQEEQPWEYEKPNFIQVFPREEEITIAVYD